MAPVLISDGDITHIFVGDLISVLSCVHALHAGVEHMIRAVGFLDHLLAGNSIEYRQEQGMFPDKRLHGLKRALHSHELHRKDNEIRRHRLRRRPVGKSTCFPVADHIRAPVAVYAPLIRDKKDILISHPFFQMISIHDSESALSDNSDLFDLHNLKLPSSAAVAASSITVGG